jgi:hypothetical protein
LESDFRTDKILNRREVSVILDEILDPFSKPISWSGKYD